jgi:hypothetical protein
LRTSGTLERIGMSWQENLLVQFVPDLGTKVWVVSDPDSLIRNEDVLPKLEGKGFEVMNFEDPMVFRFEYESRIRPAWESGCTRPLVILCGDFDENSARLPGDLLIASKSLKFGIDELFPGMDAKVLRELPSEKWAKVMEYLKQRPGKKFTSRETEEVILRLCYKMVPDIMDGPADFMRRLLDTHLLGLPLGNRVASRVAKEMESSSELNGWPVEKLCSETSFFWNFIQRGWENYVQGANAESNDVPAIPFEEPVVFGQLPRLFEQRILKKIDRSEVGEFKDWMSVGLQGNKSEERRVSNADWKKLLEGIPQEGASHREWMQLGMRYSKMVSEAFRSDVSLTEEYFWEKVWPVVDDSFLAWISNAMSGLRNLSPVPPVMTHHANKQMLRWSRKGKKVALVVLDGLSLAGWSTIRDSLLGTMKSDSDCDESAMFSWLPSLTPVCRQALYAGMEPWLFKDTDDRTNCDARRWEEFWTSQGNFQAKEVGHALIDGDGDDLKNVLPSDESRVKILGVTVSKPDEIMHGMKLGWQGWHQQMELWMRNGFLSKLVDGLIKKDFVVCLSADHGNLESVGIGKVNQGVWATTRGQRIRRYTEPDLRDKTAEELSGTTHPGFLHSDEEFMLYPKGRGAFVGKGDVVVTHGGPSLDELLVPWIVFKGRNKEL